MELTPELVVTGIAGLLIILGAIGRYLRTLHTAPPRQDPALTGIGLELGSRFQIDQLIAEVHRIGDILENKKQAGMEAMLEELTEKVDELRRGQ